MYPSQLADKFMLRLPDGMRERIRKQAEANRRTMNSEIVHCLDRAFAGQGNEGAAEGATSPRHDHSQPMQGKAND